MDSKSLPNGLLVAFEGIDGTGKTTQMELARSELAAEGWPLNTSRNLGGTPIGEELRRVMKSNLPRPEKTNLHISVAIQEALIEEISNERQQGKFILMDRGPISLAAYEIYGGGLDADLTWKYVDDGMARLKPELVIIYSTDVATALKRLRQDGQKDYFESKAPDYFERVSDGYKAAAERYSEACMIIDANRSVEDVHRDTMRAINTLLAGTSPNNR